LGQGDCLVGSPGTDNQPNLVLVDQPFGFADGISQPQIDWEQQRAAFGFKAKPAP